MKKPQTVKLHFTTKTRANCQTQVITQQKTKIHKKRADVLLGRDSPPRGLVKVEKQGNVPKPLLKKPDFV
jgi:hypothetical protein